MARHNTLHNVTFEFCKRALLNPKLEAGAGLGHERRMPIYCFQAGPLVKSMQPLMCPSLLRLNQAFYLK